MTVAPAATCAPSPMTMRGIIVAPVPMKQSRRQVTRPAKLLPGAILDVILDDVVVIDSSAGINDSEAPDHRSRIDDRSCHNDQLAACRQNQFANRRAVASPMATTSRCVTTTCGITFRIGPSALRNAGVEPGLSSMKPETGSLGALAMSATTRPWAPHPIIFMGLFELDITSPGLTIIRKLSHFFTERNNLWSCATNAV
jgi:hypothetical protein